MKNLELLVTTKEELKSKLNRLTAIPSAYTYADPKAVDEDVSSSLIIIV